MVETQGRSGRRTVKRQTGKPSLKKVMKAVKQVKRELQPESKIDDLLFARLPIPTAGTIVPLSAINQGADSNQRVGASVDVKSLQMRYDIKSEAENVGGTTPNTIRIIVFRWTDSQVPVPPDVLEQVDPKSSLNHFKSEKIKVLYDNMMTLNYYNQSASATDPFFLNDSFFNDKFYKKLGMTWKYSASVATQPNLNQLYILFISDVNNSHGISFYSRLRFQDN